MITAAKLNEKLSVDGAEYTRIVEKHGKLVFKRKTKDLYTVYDASGQSLARGTVDNLVSFLYREEKTGNGEGEVVPVPEKPVEATGDGKEKEEEVLMTGTTFVPEQRGAGTGPGTRFRAKIFGLPCTAIVRWMWKNGFSFAEIKKSLVFLLPDGQPRDTTLQLQRNALRKGNKMAPELTANQEKELFALRTRIQQEIQV